MCSLATHPSAHPTAIFPQLKASSVKRVQVSAQKVEIRWRLVKKVAKSVTLRLPLALSLSR
jgi:hypothetical protein